MRPAVVFAAVVALTGCKRTSDGGPPTVLVDPEALAPRSDDGSPPPSPGDAGARPATSLGAASAELVAVPDAIARRVALVRIARGLRRPVAIEAAPPGGARLFVVEQDGAVRILRATAVDPAPFLDLSARVSRDHEERGLLGLAFHPRFADNRRLYVNYTDRTGDTRVVEYAASVGDPDSVDPTSARELLVVRQPFANHNGGGVEFGPDGRLYVGTGDGGGAGDPTGAGQDDHSRLAKMLAIDVDTGVVTTVARGLRNPWRYAFDGKTGDLYIADVGQDRWEEIDVIPFAGLGGANFGWNSMEGDHCFRKRTCDRRGLVMPVIEYDHQTGCSVTGGEIYRGTALPELDGVYFYVDYCTAIVRSFRWRDGQVHQHWDWKPVLDPDFKLATLSSFGVDHDGELYLLSLDGDVYKLVRR